MIINIKIDTAWIPIKILDGVRWLLHAIYKWSFDLSGKIARFEDKLAE